MGYSHCIDTIHVLQQYYNTCISYHRGIQVRDGGRGSLDQAALSILTDSLSYVPMSLEDATALADRLQSIPPLV